MIKDPVNQVGQVEESDDDECIICFETLKDPIELPCQHRFCSHCLEKWRNKYDKESITKTCPKCRSSLPPSKEMLDQLKISRNVLGYMKERLHDQTPFELPPKVPTKNNKKRVDIFAQFLSQEDIGRIVSHSKEEQDTLLRVCHTKVLKRYQTYIENLEEQFQHIQDQLPVADSVSNDSNKISIPKEVYRAALVRDISTVMEWLGDPVSVEKLNATNPDEMERTLLFEATMIQDVELMWFLLQNGANVDPVFSLGVTPLAECCVGRTKDDSAKVLLSWGADKKAHPQLVLSDLARDSGNTLLTNIMDSKFGGRRCQIQGLKKRSDFLNGKLGVAGKYLKDKDRYVFVLEDASREKFLIKSSNLIRQDRTPSDCGFTFKFDKKKQIFVKERQEQVSL